MVRGAAINVRHSAQAKNGAPQVEFGRVLRDLLPHHDLDFSGVSSRPALHQCLRRARKLWAMPHPVRLQSLFSQ
jgi:hypothetical protein